MPTFARRLAQAHVWKAGEKCIDADLGFEAREWGAKAHMNAAAETLVVGVFPLNVELVRIGVDRGVMIGSG